jgi:hypothetical protein
LKVTPITHEKQQEIALDRKAKEALFAHTRDG